MKRNIIIINHQYSVSAIYGIGRFVDLLKYLFKSITDRYYVYVINFYSGSEVICKIKSCYKELYIPNVTYKDKIVDILVLYVENIENSIILYNYITTMKISDILQDKGIKTHSIAIMHSYPWIPSVQGNVNQFKYRLLKNKLSERLYDIYKIEKYYLEKADRIIALSNDSQEVLNSVYEINKSKIEIISNGLNCRFKQLSIHEINNIKHAFNLSCDEKILLYVGRIHHMKGVDVLISAFSNIIKKYSNCRLMIVGDGDFSLISHLLKEAAAKITFTGRITKKMVYDLYKVADVGIIPSLSEECSFVGIEMLMHGLPIVATNARGVRNMFSHLENSLVVDVNKSRAILKRQMEESILNILYSKELSEKLRMKARNYYLKNYRLEFMRKKYISLIESLTL